MVLTRYESCTAGSDCDLFRARAAPSKFVRERVLPAFQGDISRRDKGGSYPSDAWLASQARASSSRPVWHHSAVGAQRERKREAANKRKGCHRERESPSNRRSLPTCAGQPFRSAHLLHEQL